MPDSIHTNVVVFTPSIKFIVAVCATEIVAAFLILSYLVSRSGV